MTELCQLKGSVSQDFYLFSWFWVVDKQGQSIFAFVFDFAEIFNFIRSSAVYIPSWSQSLQWTSHLKRVFHKIFTFFSWFVPIWAVDKQGQSIFAFVSDFAEIIQFCMKLCFVHPILESISAVNITPLNKCPWCAPHRGVNLTSVIAESNCTLRSHNTYNFACLLLHLKRQLGEILWGVNTYIMKG